MVGPISNKPSLPIPARFIHGHDAVAAGKTVAKLAGLAAASIGGYLAVRHGWPLLTDYPQTRGALKLLLGVNAVASVAQAINIKKSDAIDGSIIGLPITVAQFPFGIAAFTYLDHMSAVLREAAAEFIPIPTFNLGARILTDQKGFWRRLIGCQGQDIVKRRLITVGGGKWLPEIVKGLHEGRVDLGFNPTYQLQEIAPELADRFCLAVLQTFHDYSDSKITKFNLESYYLGPVMSSPFITNEEKAEIREKFPQGRGANEFNYQS